MLLDRFFSMTAEESKIGEVLFHYHESMIKSRGSSEEEGAWRDLPEELVHNILSRLVGRDFIALQSVCKSWKSSTMSFAILTPCLLVMLNNNSSSRLHYPVSNSSIGNIDIYDCGTTPSTIIRCSNYSWLLMTIGPNNGVLFFNPFTNVKIELPPIHFPDSLCCVSFSAAPTSPDCAVFCINTAVCGKIYFCILRRGEIEWSILEFERDDNFEASSCNYSLFYKGHYYYSLSKQGDLVIYNVDNDEPRWIKSATSFLRNRLCTKRCQSFMAESEEGELLAVFMSCDGEWVQVCKLDESRMIWVPVHDLGDTSMFISNPVTFVETISAKGTENKIYVPWFRNKVPLFYSLANRRYQSFGASASYTALYESTRPAATTWIKPSSHHQLTCNLPFKFTW